MIALAVLLAILQNPSSTFRLPVDFQCTCADDSLSQVYASKVRDALAASPRYREATSADRKVKENEKFFVHIKAVTIVDAGTKESPESIAISVAVVIGDVYISQYIQTCGANKLDQCAASTMAYFDTAVHE